MQDSSLAHRFAGAVDAAARCVTQFRRRTDGRLRWSSVAIAMIVPLTGLGAFSMTRARFTHADPLPSAATLTVQTDPAGADLSLDGQARGTTPLTLDVVPGAHTFTVRRTGSERTIAFTAAAGAQLTNFVELPTSEAAAVAGRLAIVTDPPGADVIVDGRLRGVSPVIVGDLSGAQHRVAVKGNDASAERTVTLEPGVIKEVIFPLTRSTAIVGGWVTITTPFPVDLLERGEVVGTSGAAKVMLPAGRHDLVVRNGDLGYETTRKVDVTAGKITTLQVVAPKGTLNVNARPWAEVAIDGVSVGETPIANFAVAVGSHEIRFRHPELGERHLTVVVTAKGPNRAAVDLTK